MRLVPSLWRNPADHVRTSACSGPVLYMSPSTLQDTAATFLNGFPGQVTYAVKANSAPEVLDNLVAAGITGFDVASVVEMQAVRAALPTADLHFNNPVRSREEIVAARDLGVASYAVDSLSELEKLAEILPGGDVEVSVRLRLDVAGAAYDFGSKFGAGPALGAQLLRRVAELGFTPAITFHPGTQCEDPAAWARYIAVSAEVAHSAGVRIARLNVGGGFPSHRTGAVPDLARIFQTIEAATATAFGADRPALLCEPGRAMVAEAFTLASRVRAIRDDGAVFLDDGIYGGLAETAIIGVPDRIAVRSPDGRARFGPQTPRTLFGPTCDSLDRLPGTPMLPADLAEGDWVFFAGLGAYSLATVTRFNGFGALTLVTVVDPAP